MSTRDRRRRFALRLRPATGSAHLTLLVSLVCAMFPGYGLRVTEQAAHCADPDPALKLKRSRLRCSLSPLLLSRLDPPRRDDPERLRHRHRERVAVLRRRLCAQRRLDHGRRGEVVGREGEVERAEEGEEDRDRLEGGEHLACDGRVKPVSARA